MGLILTFGRLYDAAFDPFVAYLSDRTPQRIGRRRSCVICGSIGFVAACWYLYAPSADRSIEGYALGIFFFTTWTVTFTPYLAQGGEITSDSRKRTTINIMQSTLMILRSLLIAVLPYVLNDPGLHGFRLSLSAILEKYLAIGSMRGFIGFLNLPALPIRRNYANVILVSLWFMTIVAPFTTIAYVLFARDGKKSGAADSHASFSAALRNPVFMRFCGGYGLMMAGYMGRIGLYPFIIYPFIIAYTVSGGVSYLFLTLVGSICSIIVTPIWGRIFQHFERAACIAAAGAIEAVGLLVLAFSPGTPSWAIFAVCIMALPGQTLIMAPYLIAADSTDDAEWRTRTESRACMSASSASS